MTSTALSLATSVSSIVEATGLAAQFKSIVPSDLFIALGLGFLIGIVIAVVYRKTYRGVLYSPSFTLTLIMLTLITTPVVMCIKNDIALSMGSGGRTEHRAFPYRCQGSYRHRIYVLVHCRGHRIGRKVLPARDLSLRCHRRIDAVAFRDAVPQYDALPFGASFQ